MPRVTIANFRSGLQRLPDPESYVLDIHPKQRFCMMADSAKISKVRARGCWDIALALEAVCGVDFMFEIERGINSETPERVDAPRTILSLRLTSLG